MCWRELAKRSSKPTRRSLAVCSELRQLHRWPTAPQIILLVIAGLLKAMAVAVVAYNSSREGQQKDPSWFGKLLTEPILKTAARYAITC